MLKRRAIAIALSVSAVLSLPTAALAQEIYIPLLSKGFQHQFWQAVKQGADQAGTARHLEVPEGEPDEDRRLAGAPPRQGEPSATGDPAAFIQHTPSIEFEDMPPPALPPKQPL